MPAKLPTHLEEKQIADISEGQTVWTVPWAMVVDKDGTLWLKGSHTFKHRLFGTSTMKVRKENGKYVCDVRKTDRKWIKINLPDSEKAKYIPVEELISSNKWW